MSDTNIYAKQLEAENERLRSALEKQDAIIGNIVRKHLKVTKTITGSLCIGMKWGNGEYALDIEEFEALKKMGVSLVMSNRLTSDFIDDLMGRQPSYNVNQYYVDYLEHSVKKWEKSVGNTMLFDTNGNAIPAVPSLPIQKEDLEDLKNVP